MHRREPSGNIFASKLCVETGTRPPPAPTDSQRDTDKELFTSEVGAVNSKNSRSKNVSLHVTSDGETNKVSTEYLFVSAEFLLKVCRY